jgi:hypothetical protein
MLSYSITSEDIHALQGHVKTLGTMGPKYEVCEPIKQINNEDWLIKIRLLESGEETEYPYSHAIKDPEAE